ncbi:MAG TPA: hypothetical protein VLF89_05530 [Candidatus Saccharimonadales bacterium]|nr:hypothetical protein [Candidatus Saccharimonadales bacterium]
MKIFRNGLAHNYFAKAAGISRTETEPFSILDGHLVLDADRFADAFRLAIDKLKTAIQTDTQLVRKMLTRYEAQQESHAKFKLNLSQLYSTRASGASLPHPSMLKGLTTTTTSSSQLPERSKTTTTLPPSLDLKDKK